MTLTEPAATAAVSATDVVAGQMRAELARHKVTGRQLARRTGKDYAYWWRRLNGEVPMNVPDLAVVAALLEVPVTTFLAPLDVSGGRPPIGRYGDTPGHDTPNAHVCLWEDDNTFWQCEDCMGCANCCACQDDYDLAATSHDAWELAA